ncbi:50S ribosome-binding GTPase domain-containing protein [Ditylenchus destructor]|uniref:50S ribosome-binding GTPase domain-containing protein n=1 Tax=Ditylenchus destructor TaxID=166010 RepID=A0AAD4N6N0_9BILA|nr:50S ribosome-binding GTPase domain-containing protein [Ditylenchus destructor]
MAIIVGHTRSFLYRFRVTSWRPWKRLQSSSIAGTSEVKVNDIRGLRVAVIGVPNAGKSALTNVLIKADVCAVSNKIDTTKENLTTALTEKLKDETKSGKVQLVLVDSPGVIGQRHARKFVGVGSDDKILGDPEKAIEKADHILYVHDVTSPGKFIQHRILHLLHRYSHIPSSLVLNKVDLVQRQSELIQLAEILTKGIVDGAEIKTKTATLGRLESLKSSSKKKEAAEMRIHSKADVAGKDESWQKLYNSLLYKPAHKCGWNETRKLFLGESGWPEFKAVFFVSCTRGSGVDELRKYLQHMSTHATWKPLGENTLSTRSPRQLAREHIRSELLNALPGFMAYNLRPRIVDWNLEQSELKGGKSTLRMIVDIICAHEINCVRLIVQLNCVKSWTKRQHSETRLERKLGNASPEAGTQYASSPDGKVHNIIPCERSAENLR